MGARIYIYLEYIFYEHKGTRIYIVHTQAPFVGGTMVPLPQRFEDSLYHTPIVIFPKESFHLNYQN